MRRQPRTLCPFGLRLKEALERAHLSQVELADRLYVSENIVSRWMSGETEPRLSALIRIAEVTGKPIDWLCGDGGSEASVVAECEDAVEANPVQHDVGRCYDCKYYVIWGIRQNSDGSAEEIRYCGYWNPTGNPYRKPHPDGFCSNMERKEAKEKFCAEHDRWLIGNRIPYEDRAAIYEAAIHKFGEKNQMTVAVEEMSEVTKELTKMLRDDGNRDHLAEEIADATIMLEQLRLIFHCNAEVCRWMDRKVERLKERVDNGA